MKKIILTILLTSITCSHFSHPLTLTYASGPYPAIDIAITQKASDLKPLLIESSTYIQWQNLLSNKALSAAISFLYGAPLAYVGSEASGPVGFLAGGAIGAGTGYGMMRWAEYVNNWRNQNKLTSMGALLLPNVLKNTSISLTKEEMITKNLISANNTAEYQLYVSVTHRTNSNSDAFFLAKNGTWVDQNGSYKIYISEDKVVTFIPDEK